MNKRIKHIRTLLMVAAITAAFSGCQNRKNGIFGSDNWGRNGYANYFLNSGVNPNAIGEGRVIGYVVYGQGMNSTSSVPYNGTAGNVQPLNNTSSGPTVGAGQIAGGSTMASQQTPCMMKIVSGSTLNFNSGSNQSFGNMYHESLYPTSGQPFYAVGARQPITCGKDTEIAATAGSFYVTAGANGNNIWAYRFNQMGIPLGFNPDFVLTRPTKIAASSSGHIVAISNWDAAKQGGHSLTMIYEGRVDTNGAWIADKYHEIPAQNGAVWTDVAIDRQQGVIYAGLKYADGAGQVLIMRIADAFEGTFNPIFNSRFGNMNSKTQYNFSHNLPNETAVDYLFRAAMPIKIKNNNGLTGVQTAMGHPFFMETGLGYNPEETYNKTHEELNDIYLSGQNQSVQDIRVFDPFQISAHASSTYTQPGFKFKDFAVGNNMAYLITEQGVLYIIAATVDAYDASTPWENHLNMGQRLNTIEMSEDQKIAVITGSAGLSIGRVQGNNLIFASTGRPDVSESGEVIHAAVLEKVYKAAAPKQPANATANATANANAAKKADTAAQPAQ